VPAAELAADPGPEIVSALANTQSSRHDAAALAASARLPAPPTVSNPTVAMPSWMPSEAGVLDRAAAIMVPSVLNADPSTVELDEAREIPVHGSSQDLHGDSTPSSARLPYIPSVRAQSHMPNLNSSPPTQTRRDEIDGVGTSGGSFRRVYRPTTRAPVIWAPPYN
jgi:hypothetical protein